MGWRKIITIGGTPKKGSIPADKAQELKAALGDTLVSMQEIQQYGSYHGEGLSELWIALRDMTEGYLPNVKDQQRNYQERGDHGRAKALEYARERAPKSLAALENAISIASQCCQEMTRQTSSSTSSATQRQFRPLLQSSLRIKSNLEKASPIINELVALSRNQQLGNGPE